MEKKKSHIGKEDYVSAVKKADRESSLGNGWVAKDRPHKNKKKYNKQNYIKV